MKAMCPRTGIADAWERGSTGYTRTQALGRGRLTKKTTAKISGKKKKNTVITLPSQSAGNTSLWPWIYALEVLSLSISCSTLTCPPPHKRDEPIKSVIQTWEFHIFNNYQNSSPKPIYSSLIPITGGPGMFVRYKHNLLISVGTV